MSKLIEHGRAWASVAAVGLAALISWRCARAPERPARAPNAAATGAHEPGTAGAATATSSAIAMRPVTTATPSPPAPTPAASAAPASQPQGGVAGVVAAVRGRDPRDLALLARIERELKRDPPAAVHELIRRREAGATRDELLAGVSRVPASDLPLRLQLQRWVDEVAPLPGGPVRSGPAMPASSGSARPLIKPIGPAP